MESFGMRLERLRKEAGLSVKQLAYLLRISELSCENYLTDYLSPTIELMERVGVIFGLELHEVAGIPAENKVRDPHAREIFFVKELSGNVMPQMKNVEGIMYMSSDEMHGKEYYALKVKDDSMIRARIMKGDVVVVRRQSGADNGDIVVALVGSGKEVIRRYHRKGNIVTLTSEDIDNEFETIVIDTKTDSFAISGKVCQVRVDF